MGHDPQEIAMSIIETWEQEFAMRIIIETWEREQAMRKGIIGDQNSRPLGRFTAGWIQTPWVKFSDRQPAIGEVVMVYGAPDLPGDDTMAFAAYLGRDQWQSRCCIYGPEWDFILKVTHWAPRPTPPA